MNAVKCLQSMLCLTHATNDMKNYIKLDCRCYCAVFSIMSSNYYIDDIKIVIQAIPNIDKNETYINTKNIQGEVLF